MKKLLIIACLGLIGCSPEPSKEPQIVEDFQVVTFDGCEYIRSLTHGFCYVYSHKGNCKNPIHIHNGGNHE